MIAISSVGEAVCMSDALECLETDVHCMLVACTMVPEIFPFPHVCICAQG